MNEIPGQCDINRSATKTQICRQELIYCCEGFSQQSQKEVQLSLFPGKWDITPSPKKLLSPILGERLTQQKLVPRSQHYKRKIESSISHSWQRSHLIRDNNGHISGPGTNTERTFLEMQAKTTVSACPRLATWAGRFASQWQMLLRLWSPQIKGKNLQGWGFSSVVEWLTSKC